MAFKLLTCDGGGIRGYLSSRLIQELDMATGGKLLANVQGFAGTSTGGLISIALATGMKIADLVNIYKTEAATIFDKNGWTTEADRQAQLRTALADAAVGGPGKFGTAYTAKGLNKVFAPIVGTKTLDDVAPLLAINTAQLWDTDLATPRWMPRTLNNRGVDRVPGSVKLLDAALSTSAAPTYFPPHEIAGMGYFADGGTFANNPVANGIEVVLSSGAAASQTDIQVVSIGTGLSPQGIEASSIGDPLDWGLTYWMWPFASNGVPATALLNLSLDASAENLGSIAGNIMGGNLVRIQPVLKKPVPLDGYTKKDYAIMDDAVKSAMASEAWKHAVNMVNGW
jgi:patatin-like phospholipase/acyl hydrolase